MGGLLKTKRLRESRQSDPGARLSAPVGSRGKALGGVQGAKAPEALGVYSISMQNTV